MNERMIEGGRLCPSRLAMMMSTTDDMGAVYKKGDRLEWPVACNAVRSWSGRDRGRAGGGPGDQDFL